VENTLKDFDEKKSLRKSQNFKTSKLQRTHGKLGKFKIILKSSDEAK